MKILGISGWSGAGKTTLIVALLPRLRAHGLSVSTLKHAHHDVDLDVVGKDTWRHRQAGAHQVLLATPQRWALLHELRGAPEPSLPELLAELQPVDLVLIEGWKRGDYPKLEVWRPLDDAPPRFADDPSVIAVASSIPLDPQLYGRPALPILPLHDLDAISNFIAQWVTQHIE